MYMKKYSDPQLDCTMYNTQRSETRGVENGEVGV